MRPMTFVLLFLLAAALSLAPCSTVEADADLSLVINPRTGTASIRNDAGTALNIDGYLLTSTTAVFNPNLWTSFTDNAVPGWEQGPAAANRLGEGNLLSSRSIGVGASIGLGTPYLPFTPAEIGQLEPALSFEYHVPNVGSFQGDVVFAPQNNVVLVVDPATGNASLQNQSNFDVHIDGLLITSPGGVLDPVGWNGMAESGTTGWLGGAAAINRLGEGNLFGSTFLPKNGALISLGKPVNAALIDDETDVVFEYHVADGDSLRGGVTFAVSAATPVAGDYSGNGTVDAADYTIWRDTLGSMTDLRANGNNSGASAGKIDQADYQVWKSNFGSGGSGGVAVALREPTAAVPEPTTWLIGCTLGVGLAGFSRVRQRSN